MKKLVVCLALSAFAVIPALQADDSSKAPAATKTAACCTDKAASGAACCSKSTTAKKADATSKGATLLVQR